MNKVFSDTIYREGIDKLNGVFSETVNREGIYKLNDVFFKINCREGIYKFDNVFSESYCSEGIGNQTFLKRFTGRVLINFRDDYLLKDFLCLFFSIYI